MAYLRILKPGEPERRGNYSNNPAIDSPILEAYASQVEHGDTVMQIDLMNDDGTVIKTLLQHKSMKEAAKDQRIISVQTSQLAAKDSEIERLRSELALAKSASAGVKQKAESIKS